MFKNIFDKAKQNISKFTKNTAKKVSQATSEARAVPTDRDDQAFQWFNRKPNRKTPSRRRFFYIGLDNKKHSVRIGKPFSVRPKLYPNMIIATFGNRDMIRVYA